MFAGDCGHDEASNRPFLFNHKFAIDEASRIAQTTGGYRVEPANKCNNGIWYPHSKLIITKKHRDLTSNLRQYDVIVVNTGRWGNNTESNLKLFGDDNLFSLVIIVNAHLMQPVTITKVYEQFKDTSKILLLSETLLRKNGKNLIPGITFVGSKRKNSNK